MSANDLLTHTVQPRPGGGLLRLIGAFKLLKGLTLIVASIAVLKLIHADLADNILEWSRRLHVAPGNKLVAKLVEKAWTVTPGQLKVASGVLMAYAAMYLTEGVGLLLEKHWAEWMTVITTAGLIPFEIYELLPGHHPTLLKGAALLVNVVIAVYLVVHVRREARAGRRGTTPS